MVAEEMVVWDGRIARLRRPFRPPQYGGPTPDFDLANSPRSLQTATRLGAAAGHTGEITRVPIEVRDWHVVGASRPSALAQRAADEARSTRRGATGSRQAAMRSPRTLQPLALDATWLAPEQRDLLAYMDERIRETQQRILSGAKHTERGSVPTRRRPGHGTTLAGASRRVHSPHARARARARARAPTCVRLAVCRARWPCRS